MTSNLESRPITNKTRTVSSNDAKQHWGAMIKAANSGEAVIVESHGKPKAVVISPEAFEEYQTALENQRRAELVKQLEELQLRQAERNKDLTDEQVEEIAVRVGREINRAVAERHRAIVERQRAQ